MSGLLGSLLRNAQALSVHAQQLDITGKNLANINNPAYARQRVHVGDLGSIQTNVGVQSMGIIALTLQQQRDAMLDRQVQRDITALSTLKSRHEALLAADAALGERLDRAFDTSNVTATLATTGGGLSQLITQFFQAWESFSIRPDSQAERILLIEKSNALANRINEIESRLAEVQEDLTTRLNNGADQVQRILETIASLNTQIARAETGTNHRAVDLRDQRQAQIEELAKYMNFTWAEQPDTTVHITAQPGVTLVNSSGVQGTFTFNSAPSTFTGGSPPTILSITGGELASNLDVRNNRIVDIRNDLRNLANQFITSVNNAYANNFFNPAINPLIPNTPPSPAATLLTVLETVATLVADASSSAPSANANALQVAALATQNFTDPPDYINGTFSSFLASTVAGLGQDINLTYSRLTDQQIALRISEQYRSDVSGVSQDEEVTNMLRFQRTFQASARYTNVLDELLELVANRLGNF